MAKNQRKVLVITGNTMEIGQVLTNIVGMNPELVIHNSFTSQSVREVKQPALQSLAVNQQISYEPITVIYLIYSLPGELQGIELNQISSTVKARPGIN